MEQNEIENNVNVEGQDVPTSSPSDLTRNSQTTKQEKAEAAGKDVAEVGAKAVGTYFGGAVGAQIADVATKTKAGQAITSAVGENLAKNPIMKNRLARNQKKIAMAKPFINRAINSNALSSASDTAKDSVQGTDNKINDLNNLPNLNSDNKDSQSKKSGFDNLVDKKNDKGFLSALLTNGLKSAWDTLPLVLKIKIIAGAAGVLFFILLIVIIASATPFNFLDYSVSSIKTFLTGGTSVSSVQQQIAESVRQQDFDDEFAEYWYELCSDEDECSDEEVKEAQKLKNSQVRFYKRLDKLKKRYGLSDTQENLVLTTIFFNTDIEEFYAGGTYNLDADGDDDIDFDTATKQYDTDTLKELIKQFKAYSIMCTYDAYDKSQETYIKNTIEMKNSDGDYYTLNFWERFRIKYLGFYGSGSDYVEAKQNCENNYLNGEVSIADNYRNGASSDSFFKYLLTSDFLDNRVGAQDYFIDYARNNNLDANDISNWADEEKQEVRKQIIDEIKEIVEDYEEEEEPQNNIIALMSTAYCSNGITVQGEGTLDFNEYLIGVLSAEYGGLITDNPEAAKAAAVAIRTFVIAKTDNCSRSISSSESVIVYHSLSEGQSGYSVYKEAVEATNGQVLVDSDGNVKGGQFVTLPISQYREESGGMYTFHMQGIAGYEQTNYDYSISVSDVERIASKVGGVYYPEEGSGHHWGSSQYAIVKMAEDGMTYDEILANTYCVGGVVSLARGIAGGESAQPGLTVNHDGTFLMRAEPVSPDSGNPYYNFYASNYGQCAWYAQERSDEILSTMGWYKTQAYEMYNGNGGNGNDYCYYATYNGYTHHWDPNEEGAIKPGNIISWDSYTPAYGASYGHVAVIEDVIGDTIIYSEAWISNPSTGHISISTVTKSELISYYGGKDFICTIDLSTGRD